MAIYRNIQISFWTDAKIVDDFSPAEKMLYLYLMTNPHTNLCGCYEISKKQIAYETGYDMSTVQELLGALEHKHQVIIYAEAEKEILLINWSKYNWTKSEQFKKALLEEVDLVKSQANRRFLKALISGDSIADAMEKAARVKETVSEEVNTISEQKAEGMDTVSEQKIEGIDTVCIPSMEGIDTVSTSNSNSNSNSKVVVGSVNNNIYTGTMPLESPPTNHQQTNANIDKAVRRWNSIPNTQKISGLIFGTSRYSEFFACVSIYGFDKVLEAMQKVESSEYLKTKQSLRFDNYMNRNAMQKLLDGEYDKDFSKQKKTVKKTAFTDFEQRSYDDIDLEEALVNK